jgi:hypothetical protein
MTTKHLAATSLVLLAALAGAASASAGEVMLSISDGRVMLFAQDATLGQILAEWERVGRTRIINRELLPAGRVTLSLANEPESEALAVVLRALGGYLAVRRTTWVPGASIFDRIIILSGAAPVQALSTTTPQATNAAPSIGGRGQVQRRVMADGRVVSFVENPDRPGELTMVDDDGADQATPAGDAVRPTQGQPSADPFNLEPPPGAGQQGGRNPTGSPGSSPAPGVATPGQAGPPRGQFSSDPFNLEPPAPPGQPWPKTTPTPPGTAAAPGAVAPGQKTPAPNAPGPPKGRGGKSKPLGC